MNFFCTKNHFGAWASSAGSNPDQYGLPVAEAVTVARGLFGAA
jgi:hypothetical protein